MFKDSHFEFWVKHELTKKCHYGLFSVFIESFIQINMNLETKILSLSILDAEY